MPDPWWRPRISAGAERYCVSAMRNHCDRGHRATVLAGCEQRTRNTVGGSPTIRCWPRLKLLLTPCLPDNQSREAKYEQILDLTGAPDTIRTCDLCLRRATLYPAELRVRGVHLADRPGIGNARQAPDLAKMAGLEDAAPSLGDGHAFESCRVRQERVCPGGRDCGAGSRRGTAIRGMRSAFPLH